MHALEDLIGRLAPDTLLRALTPEQLQELLRSASRRDLARGETIIEQGDEDGNYALCLLSGALKISMVSTNGREIILHYCEPGEVVGEIAMLDSGPRTATVSAIEPSSVLIIPSHAFVAAALSNPGSMAGVMRALARRIRQLNLIVESDRAFSMAPRLARALVRLLGTGQTGGKLRHNPSQSDLGAFAGLARENVSRLLSEWEAQGIVAREGRSLVLRDVEYLQFLSEFGDDN